MLTRIGRFPFDRLTAVIFFLSFNVRKFFHIAKIFRTLLFQIFKLCRGRQFSSLILHSFIHLFVGLKIPYLSIFQNA